MKKLLFVFISITLCLTLTACSQKSGKTGNVNIEIGMSEKFTNTEIEDATNLVKKKFADFKGCDLTQLWYDEAKSDSFIDGYLTHGRGSTNGAKAENVIILLSTFTVDSSGGNGSFNPNSTYDNWNWILIRDGKDDSWSVDDWGY